MTLGRVPDIRVAWAGIDGNALLRVEGFVFKVSGVGFVV